ncbi:MAG: hypothetical protein CM1200mP18_00910 [Gammaproteobacteria bacterium]|nr:MAG: hypothetical protein CM1200mP18_00910 [Gammaproteobacteria bacterium]
MAAYLIVRAVVPGNRPYKFDQWYQDVPLPEALSAFDAMTHGVAGVMKIGQFISRFRVSNLG